MSSARPLLLVPLVFLSISTGRGEVEIVAGEPATVAVSEPFGVDFDGEGRLHGVEFTKSNRVFRVSGGKVEFIAGVRRNTEKEKPEEGGDVKDGDDPLAALFHGMHDIQITRDGTALLADSFNHRVRRLDLASGKVGTLAGTGAKGFGGDGGPATGGKFNITMTAVLSPDGRFLHIADIGNHRVRQIDLASGVLTTAAGNGERGLPVDGAGALSTPMGDARAAVQAQDGTLYVLLRGGNALVAVKDGKVRTVVNRTGKKGYGGDGGPAVEATMNGPKYIAMDRQGRVLIADAENHCIRRFDPETGKIALIAGTPPTASNEVEKTLLETGLRRPHGVRIGPDGRLYVCDTYNNRVLAAPYPD